MVSSSDQIYYLALKKKTNAWDKVLVLLSMLDRIVRRNYEILRMCISSNFSIIVTCYQRLWKMVGKPISITYLLAGKENCFENRFQRAILINLSHN